jgi:hypothetical protein
MLFTKEHLSGFYKWFPETERSIFDGNATRRLFDRFNGNQILFIINLLMDTCGNYSIELGKKIEEMILDKLPLGTKSELTVYNWLYLEIGKK